MHEVTLLQDMAIVMAVSAAVMILCHLARLPVVLGYIAAGLIIGPHTPPFPLVTDLRSIQTLSELGVIFLLFGIGLEFSLTKLLRVGAVSFIAATLEIALMLWIGFSLGRAFGWRPMDSLFLGAILSISSTTIIAKVLWDMGKLEEPFAHVILGILIIEDLLAIVIIALLSGLASTGALTFAEAGMATLRVGSFIAATLFLGLWLVPRLLNFLERFRSDELMVVTVLGLCFGVSLIAAQLGFSVALGAFLIGAIIAETAHAHGIIRRIAPIRDMFTAIFFVSVGMLLEPRVMAQYAWPIAIITLVTVVGKVASCTFATYLTGYPSETSLRVGLGLAQIGEFSFIIARLGETTRVTSGFLYPIAVSVSSITTLTTPFLMRHAEHIIRWLMRHAPRPLITLGSLYRAWFERLRTVQASSERQQAIWSGLKRQIPRLFLYTGCAFAIVFAAARFESVVPLHGWTYWGLVGVGMFPLVFAVTYTVDRIVWDVVVMNLMPREASSAQAGQTREALHGLLRLFAVLVCGFGLLAVSSVFVPAMTFSIGVFGLMIAASLVLWGSARDVHERMERTVLQVFEREEPGETPAMTRSREELVQLIRDEYPWEVETQDLVLPYKESAVNQSIRALRLRTATGATIVAIYRGDEPMVNPLPETVLMPGDVLLLMGSHEQVEAAVRLLQELMHGPLQTADRTGPGRTVKVEILTGSRWAGRTIAALNVRQMTEAHVVGVQKADRAITNPDGSVMIEAGDTLVLFGRADQLDRAVAYLTGSVK